jgi:hypothetical protein
LILCLASSSLQSRKDVRVVRYFQTGDVMRALNVSAPTVRALVRRGALRVAAMTVSGAFLFAEVDVRRAAETRYQRATSRPRPSKTAGAVPLDDLEVLGQVGAQG